MLDALYADDYLATDAPRALEMAADLDFERGEVAALGRDTSIDTGSSCGDTSSGPSSKSKTS